MYTRSSMPSTTSVMSTYATFVTSSMVARSMFRDVQSMTIQLWKLIPPTIRQTIISKIRFLHRNSSSTMTLIIDERLNGLSSNEVFEASQLYLRETMSPSNATLNVSKAASDKAISITPSKGEEIIDFYQGVQLRWVMICNQKTNNNTDNGVRASSEKVDHHKYFELSFLKEHKEVIIASYLPHIMEFAKTTKEANRVVKLMSLGGGGTQWAATKLYHPSTFDTLAMDPKLKKAIMDDLDRFVKRKEYYRRVGKAWKRGYLLYGPPGTGKSSLIAAMANYLKFNIYDLELTNIYDNMALRKLLVTTKNRSIVVIEDIDCTVEIQNRRKGGSHSVESLYPHNGITLSRLLNFIDGLWSSCGEERIIVFTTNFKDKLDPALLRPGRMDMHIHMSYITPSGFRVLAFNYLDISSHPLFTQIEDLIAELEVTPATVAEELMKSDDDPNAALESLLQLLQNKKSEVVWKPDPRGEDESNEPKEEIQDTVVEGSQRKEQIIKLKRKHAELCG